MGWQNEQTCLGCGEEWEKMSNEAKPLPQGQAPWDAIVIWNKSKKDQGPRSWYALRLHQSQLKGKTAKISITSLICLEWFSYYTVHQTPNNVKHHETFITTRKASTVPFVQTMSHSIRKIFQSMKTKSNWACDHSAQAVHLSKTGLQGVFLELYHNCIAERTRCCKCLQRYK